MSDNIPTPDVFVVFFHDAQSPDIYGGAAQPIVAGEICAIYEEEELALQAIASKVGGSPKKKYFVRKYAAVNPYLKAEPEVVTVKVTWPERPILDHFIGERQYKFEMMPDRVSGWLSLTLHQLETSWSYKQVAHTVLRNEHFTSEDLRDIMAEMQTIARYHAGRAK